MGVSCDCGCRPWHTFSGLAILWIFLLGFVALVSSLPKETQSESFHFDQDDLVEMPQEITRTEFKGSADSLPRVDRAKRDSLFMERTIFFTNDDGDDEDEQGREKDAFIMDSEGKRSETGEEDQKQKENNMKAFRTYGEGKKEVDQSLKRFANQQKDTTLSEEKKAGDLDRSSSDNSPSKMPYPVVDFIEQSRNFLIRFLDIENLLNFLEEGLWLSRYQIMAINEKSDKWARRSAFLDTWIWGSKSGMSTAPYWVYNYIRMFRPGLVPVVTQSKETYQDQEPYVVRQQMVPPDDKQSNSCRLHILHDILQHKTHFIEKMEKSTSLEKFFSEVTRKFDSETDRGCRKETEAEWSSREQNILRNGYWLHCLDYASGEKKFEFVKKMKEEQPQLFSENPLSKLLAKLERTSPNEVCTPEKPSHSSSGPVANISLYNGKPLQADLLAYVERINEPVVGEKYLVHLGLAIPSGPLTEDTYKKSKVLTTFPFFVAGSWLYHWTTKPVMWDTYSEKYMNSTSNTHCAFLSGVGYEDFNIMALAGVAGIHEGDINIVILDRMDNKRVFTMRFKDEVDGNTTTWELL